MNHPPQRILRPHLALLASLLLACGEPSDVEPPDSDPTPSATDPQDSPADSPFDSEPAVETDPPVDSEPPPPAPPTSWGAGLVEVPGPWLDPPYAHLVDLGSMTPFRQPEITSGVFVDLDGDDRAEVLVSSLVRPAVGQSHVASFDATLSTLAYRDDLTAAVPASLNAVVGAFDLDGDALTDLIYGNPQSHLALGVGPATWNPPSRVGQAELFADTGGGHSAFDLDEDGWLDLLIATRNCSASLEPALLRPHQRYERRPDLLSLSTGGGGADSVLSLLLPTGAQLHVPVTTSCDWSSPHPGFFRPTGLDDDGLPRFEAYDASPPDAEWKFDPAFAGKPFTVVMPMGAATADLDGDGVLDLMFALGYPKLAVLRGHADGTFTDVTTQADLWFPPTPFGHRDVPWSIVTPDLDHDGRPEIIVALGDDATSFRLLNGYATHPQVFWNGGDFRFTDVSQEVGTTALQGSWHGIVTDDPDGDGDADLLIGGFGSAVRMLRNDLDTGTRGLSIRLRGQTSNHLGHGAQIEVQVQGLPDQLLAVGGTGNFDGFNHTPVFAGAGTADHADLVRITWPSGYVQEVRDLPAGQRHTIVEPPVLTVAPATRAAPADGSSEITITVRPHHPDGTPDPDASVQAGLSLEGGAEIIAVHEQAPGVHLVRVRAADAPGSSVVTVQVDGMALKVRPRLFWEAPSP
jgi:hypothetical protein